MAKFCLYFLLMLCAVPRHRAQRPYPCGMRPCSPEFKPACGWKSLEDGGTTHKMFPNICKMEEENDCDKSSPHPWINYDSCPSQLAKDKESLRIKYQEENEEDEENFKKFLDYKQES